MARATGNGNWPATALKPLSAESKLLAKWTYQTGQAVSESSLNIASGSSETRHEFHIQKASAWPKGNYKVEILLDGVSAGTKDFSVK